MNTKENISLSFVKRWIKAFTRIINKYGNNIPTDNEKLIDDLLKDQNECDLSPEELEEKRKVMMDICDEVDIYHEKLKEASDAEDLQEWYDAEVRNFVKATIPDSDDSDVKEVKEILEHNEENEIRLRAELLKDEFKADSDDKYNDESQEGGLK